jgi:hypothetical protein
MVHNQIIMSQQGTSGRYAKISVAKKTLEMLKGLPLPEFRVNYKCDCKSVQTTDEGEEQQEEEEIRPVNESENHHSTPLIMI